MRICCMGRFAWDTFSWKALAWEALAREDEACEVAWKNVALAAFARQNAS